MNSKNLENFERSLVKTIDFVDKNGGQKESTPNLIKKVKFGFKKVQC